MTATGKAREHQRGLCRINRFAEDVLVADHDGVTADEPAPVLLGAVGNFHRLVTTQAYDVSFRCFICQQTFVCIAWHDLKGDADLAEKLATTG